MGKFRDRTGEKIGRLTVIDRAEDYVSENGDRRTMWRCVCDCGKEITVRADSLCRDHEVSCGCRQKELMSELGKKYGGRVKHGQSRERLYNIWYLIKYRCEDESSPAYKNYGGRGVKMCSEWGDPEIGYDLFKTWALSNGYSENLTIDRIDNDGDYAPDNCRWADNKTQGNNKRSNVVIEYRGEKKNAAQWADELKIPKSVLYRRLELGWDVERALTQPVRKSSKSHN